SAGVSHHVTLSPVGTERLSESPYFRARIVQEYLVAQSGVPYSMVRASQSFELLMNFTDGGGAEPVRLAPVRFEPAAADDVAKIVARVAVGAPTNRVIEATGPEEFRLDELIRELLVDGEAAREVIADPEARYFGARLFEDTLLPGDGARRGEIRLDEWRAQLA